MATIVSTRILRLQGVSPRTAVNTLPSTIGLGSANLISGTAAATVVANAATGVSAYSLAETKLAIAGGDILTGIIDVKVTSNYNAGIRVGSVTWNTSTGAITGGSGVVMTRLGLIGVASGVTTFSLNASTGAALFKGDVETAGHVVASGNSSYAGPSGTVFGAVIGTCTTTTGVYGASSSAGFGVQGDSTGNGAGVYGWCDSGGNGVQGKSSGTNAIGVYGVALSGSGSVGVYAQTNVSGGLALYASGKAEVTGAASVGAAMTCTTAGTFKANIGSGGYVFSSTAVHELVSDQSGGVLSVANNHASTPAGIAISYAGASPNGTGNPFVYCIDNAGGTTVRAEIRSNGGFANFSANDVNLSDERTKFAIKPAASYWDKWKRIEFVTSFYRDQRDPYRNLGVVAQQLEQVAPELVSNDGFGLVPWDGVPLKGVYETDFMYAMGAVVQELQAKVDMLEARLH